MNGFMKVLAVALVTGAAGPAMATVFSVSPGDDLQAAIDTAITGDTIEFAPGTYTVADELYIYNKGITLKGLGKALGTTIQRDAGSATDHRVFFIEGPAGTYDPGIATVLDGFTIKNGVAPASGLGGNIYVKEAPYTVIQNSIIENGHAWQYGGGIDMEVGGTLLNSIVRNNSTDDHDFRQGGGVYTRYGGNVIENSIIYGNWADVGGGVAMQNSGVDNDPGLGGLDSRTRILNSTIADNFADGYAAYGIYGGGVASQLQGKEALITDSIVYDNLRTGGQSDIFNITIAGAGTLTTTYTDTEVPNYAGTGNIYTDPLFEATGLHPWDYYKLQGTSPALTGSSTSGPMGAVLDLSYFMVFLPGDANLDGTVNGLDLSVLAANWQRTGDSVWATADFNGDMTTNGLDLSILASNWQTTASAGDGVSFNEALAALGLGTIPEPTSLMLLAGGCAMLARRRRRV